MNGNLTQLLRLKYLIVPTDLFKVFKKNEEIALTVVNPITGIISILGNILMLIFLLVNWKKTYRNPTKVFLIIFNAINIICGILLIWFTAVMKTIKVNVKIALPSFATSIELTDNLATYFGTSLFVLTITSMLLAVMSFDQLLICLNKRDLKFKIINYILVLIIFLLCLMIGLRIRSSCPTRMCYKAIALLLLFFSGEILQLIMNVITLLKLQSNTNKVINVQPISKADSIETGKDMEEDDKEIQSDNLYMTIFILSTSIITFVITIPTWLANFKVIESTSLLIYSSVYMNSIWSPILFLVMNRKFRQFINTPFKRTSE
ncbi:DgyrCDS13539 [Dimorphilus gyrociliatus]|uniref:DgyrCDS13539 n=1 Tax=Dimorphilus gyrociliatus TaxID=2664684 RepID=A0A7I8WAY2_9ANNE|nr:DgyrCDS13539 [Dimorphilus gyrociliatus]